LHRGGVVISKKAYAVARAAEGKLDAGQNPFYLHALISGPLLAAVVGDGRGLLTATLYLLRIRLQFRLFGVPGAVLAAVSSD